MTEEDLVRIERASMALMIAALMAAVLFGATFVTLLALCT